MGKIKLAVLRCNSLDQLPFNIIYSYHFNRDVISVAALFDQKVDVIWCIIWSHNKRYPWAKCKSSKLVH